MPKLHFFWNCHFLLLFLVLRRFFQNSCYSHLPMFRFLFVGSLQKLRGGHFSNNICHLLTEHARSKKNTSRCYCLHVGSLWHRSLFCKSSSTNRLYGRGIPRRTNCHIPSRQVAKMESQDHNSSGSVCSNYHPLESPSNSSLCSELPIPKLLHQWC